MNTVIGITTGFTLYDFTERLRNRPKITLTNSSIAREEFGSLNNKLIQIPTFIQRYNIGIGGVN